MTCSHCGATATGIYCNSCGKQVRIKDPIMALCVPLGAFFLGILLDIIGLIATQ